MERDEFEKIEPVVDEAIRLRDSGRLSEAADKLREILAMSPERRAPILGVLAHIYFTMKDFDRALECYEEAVELSAKSELGSLGLFHTLWNLGRTSDAFKEAGRFLALRDSEEYSQLIKEMREGLESADH
ncbi:MAG: tetratricopeptide repeat protein [Pyrinomonadaceae bacterium]